MERVDRIKVELEKEDERIRKLQEENDMLDYERKKKKKKKDNF
jgi:uncharacterized small protein (DUF1192 family)